MQGNRASRPQDVAVTNSYSEKCRVCRLDVALDATCDMLLPRVSKQWWLLQHLFLAVTGFYAACMLLEIADGAVRRKTDVVAEIQELLMQFPLSRYEASQLTFQSTDTTNSTMLGRSQSEENMSTTKPTAQSNRSRVLIIVPYRNRSEQLAIFVPELSHFLSEQELEYKLVVVEHSGMAKFNKGSLINIGFLEAENIYHNKLPGQDTAYFDCVVVHDIDLLPIVSANSYDCLQTPDIGAWMLSTAIEKYNWSLPGISAVGGVGVTTRTVFMKANGWSNRYFGWGGEDNDFFTRLHAVGSPMHKRSTELGRYRSLQDGHYRSPGRAENPYSLLQLVGVVLHREGLNSVQYRRLRRETKNGYDLVSVELWQLEDPEVMKNGLHRPVRPLPKFWKSIA